MNYGIVMVDLARRQIDTLFLPGPSALIEGRLHWMWSPAFGRDALVFSERDATGSRTWILDPLTRRRIPVHPRLFPSEAPSPDGRDLVYVAPQPRDSVPVLFCREFVDTLGVTRRQITAY
jgi:hypothetical protein